MSGFRDEGAVLARKGSGLIYVTGGARPTGEAGRAPTETDQKLN
ncbi:hypothetical protein ABIB25_004409 [Nakamurella sp. UYEF19]